MEQYYEQFLQQQLRLLRSKGSNCLEVVAGKEMCFAKFQQSRVPTCIRDKLQINQAFGTKLLLSHYAKCRKPEILTFVQEVAKGFWLVVIMPQPEKVGIGCLPPSRMEVLTKANEFAEWVAKHA